MKCLGKCPSKEPSRRVRYDRAQLIQRYFSSTCAPCFSFSFRIRNFVTPIVESVRTPARITPYPTGRLFWEALSQALRARLRSVLSLRDALADFSQQPLATQGIWLGVGGVRHHERQLIEDACRARLRRGFLVNPPAPRGT